MRQLQDRRQLHAVDQISSLNEEIVLFRQRLQRLFAIQVVVVELGGDGARPQRIVEERVGGVRMEVLLPVERSSDREDPLRAQVCPDIGEAGFRFEEVLLHAAGIAEGVVRFRRRACLERRRLDTRDDSRGSTPSPGSWCPGRHSTPSARCR